MTFTRRTIVRLAAAAGFAPLLPGCRGGEKDDTGGDEAPTSAPGRSTEPPPWAAPGTEDTTAFPAGLLVGDATTTSAVVAVRTAEVALTLVVMAPAGESWAELDRIPVTAADGGSVLLIDGLTADTPYALAIYADATRRTSVTRLRTAAATARIVQFGATSCLGDAEPTFPSMAFAARDALDFFLLLGDAVYADGAVSLEDYRAYWSVALATPSVRSCFGSTSLVATWDDHEVANNWSWDDVDEAQYTAALTAYRESLPQGAGPTGAIWRKVSWGETLDLFVLDCRSERRDGHYISPEQMAWLQAELAASTARFKIILNSVPITDLTPLFNTTEIDDRWDGYPEERTDILDFINNHPITGVVWITGDVHFAAVTHVDPPGGPAEAAWEVFVGPAGSTPNALVELLEPDAQYTWLSSAWNWTRFTCDPGLGTVRVEHIGDEGSVLNDVTLSV